MRPQSQTLFAAINQINFPSDEKMRVGFMRAEDHPGLSYFADHDLFCEQTFKPDHDSLIDAGFDVSREPLTGKFQAILYLATRQHVENISNMARALNLLEDGGVLLVAQHNNYGAKRLEKDLKTMAGSVESFSKNHCRAFWVYKDENLDKDLTLDLIAKGGEQNVQGTSLRARAGVFSWQKIDRGSQVLARNLPADLSGNGADLGAGWGYLSDKILSSYQHINTLNLVEAEWLALDMALKNLEPHNNRCTINALWADVREERSLSNLDFVISNPPQHDAHGDDKNLTPAFIEKAHSMLKKGGTFYFVTPAHLPIETITRETFKSVNILTQEDGFKVLAAVR